jgi:hypothetical protein
LSECRDVLELDFTMNLMVVGSTLIASLSFVTCARLRLTRIRSRRLEFLILHCSKLLSGERLKQSKLKAAISFQMICESNYEVNVNSWLSFHAYSHHNQEMQQELHVNAVS